MGLGTTGKLGCAWHRCMGGAWVVHGCMATWCLMGGTVLVGVLYLWGCAAIGGFLEMTTFVNLMWLLPLICVREGN